MEINNKIIVNEFPKISEGFKLEYFNNLSITDKKELLLNLSKITANCLGGEINSNNISFVDKEEIEIGGASFSFNENLIRINKGLLNEKLNFNNFSILLEYIVHETVHFCQKQKGVFLEHLSNPLPVPYRTSQPHELDAYNTSEKIFDLISEFLDNDLQIVINDLKNTRSIYKDLELLDLMKRHYSQKLEDIQNQIQQMLPFYKNVNEIDKLQEEHKLDIKIKMLNQHIDAISMNDNGICGILSVNDIDGINKLHFTIKNDICFINEIIKIENKNKKFMPVSNQNKEILISNLNKIINIGNEINFFNCKKYLINPISIVDDKEIHDKFIDDIKNGKIKSSNLFKNVISEKQIKNNVFKNIDGR